MRVKLIYGTDTESTEYVINNYLLKSLETDFEVELIEVSNIKPEDWQTEDFIILGLPTWYDGQLQSDWEDYFEEFKKLNFAEKTVAIFGLGDQIGYSEYFVDSIGVLAKVVLENGGKIIGHWPSSEYDFDESKASMDENTFYGLAIDEDNEYELTEERCDKWVQQLKAELKSKNKL